MTDGKENRKNGSIELDAEDLDKIVGGASGKISSSPTIAKEEGEKFVYSPETPARIFEKAPAETFGKK